MLQSLIPVITHEMCPDINDKLDFLAGFDATMLKVQIGD
jgi:hypothetical protein